MEFQFGTNWSHFSRFAGGVIGQTLAMEGLFAFFLESAFLGLFLYGEKRLSQADALVLRPSWCFLGSWLSGYFIVATDAWMQHPVGYTKARRRLRAAHQLLAAGAESLGLVAIRAQHERRCHHWRICHGGGRRVLSARPESTTSRADLRAGRRDRRTDLQRVATVSHRRRRRARWWPRISRSRWPPWRRCSTRRTGAPLVIIGQPEHGRRKASTIPSIVPKMLSFLTYRALERGSERPERSSRRTDWPQNIPLLYYTYHIMVGLGTIFIAIIVVAAFLLWRGKLFTTRAGCCGSCCWRCPSPTSPTPPAG